MLGAALVATGLGCLSLGDCHERPQSVAEHASVGSQMGHFGRSQHRSSERELPCRLDRIQEGAVVRDDDERAVVGVGAPARAARPPPGRGGSWARRARAGSPHVPAARPGAPSFAHPVTASPTAAPRGRHRARTSASSVRASTVARPVVSTNASRRRHHAVLDPLLPDRSGHGRASECPRPLFERKLPEEHSQQRRLAAAVAASHGEPLTRDEVEVERAEREFPPPSHGAGEARNGAARTGFPPGARAAAARARTASRAARCRSSSRSAWRTFVIRACVPRSVRHGAAGAAPGCGAR